MKKNFINSIRYEIPAFSSVASFFEEGGEGSRKFWPEAEIFGIFSIAVPNQLCWTRSSQGGPFWVQGGPVLVQPRVSSTELSWPLKFWIE